MDIPIKIIGMLSANGYVDRFYAHCKTCATDKEAYEKTEKEFQDYFGKRRYSDYNSYRGARDKRLKKNVYNIHKKKL